MRRRLCAAVLACGWIGFAVRLPSSAEGQEPKDRPQPPAAAATERPTLDAVLTRISASDEERAKAKQVMAKESERWRSWWAGHFDELEALRLKAEAATDQQALTEVHAKILGLLKNAPQSSQAWEAIKQVFAEGRRKELTESIPGMPSLSVELHAALRLPGKTDHTRACVNCHFQHRTLPSAKK